MAERSAVRERDCSCPWQRRRSESPPASPGRAPTWNRRWPTSSTCRRWTREPVDVSVLIERVCHFYRRKAAEKQISITPDLHVEEPDARADRVAVAVVMDNLLSNAIKYSPHGRIVRVFVRAEPGFLVCSVQD